MSKKRNKKSESGKRVQARRNARRLEAKAKKCEDGIKDLISVSDSEKEQETLEGTKGEKEKNDILEYIISPANFRRVGSHSDLFNSFNKHAIAGLIRLSD